MIYLSIYLSISLYIYIYTHCISYYTYKNMFMLVNAWAPGSDSFQNHPGKSAQSLFNLAARQGSMEPEAAADLHWYHWTWGEINQAYHRNTVVNYHGHELLGRRCGMPDACRLSGGFLIFWDASRQFQTIPDNL